MLNTPKLSSKMPENSNADKAQYYKVILDNERTVREQADKEIIELLHDVKQRYESKLKSYMAKKQPGGGGDHTDKSPAKDSKKGQVNGTAQETQNDDWGAQTQNDDWGATTQNDDWGAATTTQNDDWATTAQNDDWGTETETPAKDTNNKENSKKNNKGDNKKNKNDKKNKEKEEEKKKDNDDWGNSTETPTQQTQNDDWGATTQNDDWGTTTETPANNSTTSNNKDSKKNNKGDNKKNKNDKKNKEKEKSKDDDGWGNSTETPAQQTQNDDWGATTQNDDWGTTTETPANDSSKNKDSKKNKDDNGSKDPQASGQTQAQEQKATGPAQPSKEFLDMKSQLWTAKLDLRLLEREKSKLTDEVSTIRAERDDLIKKMAQANQEQDSMKVKVRGLTVDLLAANDEIHKLNERIDELEAERRNRERDVNFSENKRRSMECRYKNYQQQIADLQSELSLIKEEKLEFEKTATELAKRNERLENDLSHSKSLIRTLKDGCALVENQARTFEIRHDTVIMSKADLERELIAIKEESSRHITTINKLQKSNEQISKAFIQSVEAHEACKKEVEKLHREYSRKLEGYQIENLRLVEANKQLRKVIDHLQKKR